MSALLRVEEPGLHTTIQDLGRAGHRLGGVPPSGAMDRFAIAAANLLVGNPESAAALECALSGPALTAGAPVLVAVTGADFEPQVNGEAVPTWTGLLLATGDRLSFRGRRSGARTYVAVAGGLAADRWLGSAATYLLVARGGLHGRALKAGDELHAAGPAPRPAVADRTLNTRPLYSAEPTLGVVAGPHRSRLVAGSRRTFYSERWAVSRESDRMGYRLEGSTLEMKGADLISFGLAMGCIQVPNSGQPILLMADHQTAGGYPVVGGVCRADLPLAAQLLPGDHLTFEDVSVAAAQERWRSLRAALNGLRR